MYKIALMAFHCALSRHVPSSARPITVARSSHGPERNVSDREVSASLDLRLGTVYHHLRNDDISRDSFARGLKT